MEFVKRSESYGYIAYYADSVYNHLKDIENGFIFQPNGENLSVLVYIGTENAISIPSSYNGKQVTAIAENCFKNKSNIISVEIPTTVTSIGKYAFSGCSSLTSIVIPESVTSIGIYAFSSCSSLTSKVIPESVTSIGSYAFSDCSSLTSIVIPNSVVFFGHSAFYSCNELCVDLSANTITISGSEFNGIKSLIVGNNVTVNSTVSNSGIDKVLWLQNNEPRIMGNVTYVSSDKNGCVTLPYLSSRFKDGVFTCVPISPSERTCIIVDCDYLTEDTPLEIPQTVSYRGIEFKVVELGAYLLARQNKITSLAIGDDVTRIGASAFYGCSSVSEINLPNQLLTIGYNAFRDCSNLDRIDIPSTVTSIGNNAFRGCESLKELVFYDGEEPVVIGGYLCPNSPLEYLRIGRKLNWGNGSYYNCSPFSGKSTIKTAWITDVPTTVQDYLFYNCDNLENVYVGDNVTSIGERAFSGCKSIKKFQFGKNVGSIGDEAFSDCIGITDIFAEPAVPPTCGTQALDDLDRWACTLHVPESAMAAYQAAPQWKEFLFSDSNFQVAMSDESLTLEVGQSFEIKAVSSDGTPLRWESSNPDVAIVHPVGADNNPSRVNSAMMAVAREGNNAQYERCIVEIVGQGVATIAAFNGNDVMASCQINGKEGSGIEEIEITPEDYANILGEQKYTVYNLQGVCLMHNGDYKAFQSLKLHPGIYIVNGKKVLVK